MNALFGLPNELLIEMYKKCTTKELLRMLESGDRLARAKSDAVIRALFMQKTDVAKSYQKKIIQSWFEGRSTYPCPFESDHQAEFFEALKGLDVPYQIVGLHVTNKVDNSIPISELLAQLVQDVCQGAAGTEKMLTLFSSKLNENHITTLLAGIQGNLSHLNSGVRNNTQKALTTLAPKLNESSITVALLAQIQNNLSHQDYEVRTSAQ